ncbi:MAG TPA: hypothetical protein VIN72_13140 [Lutibacter sp.]
MWFEKLVGFKENSPEQVRENIEIIGNRFISKINNREFIFGKLETPSLEELRGQSNIIAKYHSQIKVSEVVGNIQTFHKDVSNNNSVIQVASQFNLLEMHSPNRTPEDGVGIYEDDATQGPACAIACGAGTIYRNYFACVNGQVGQTSTKQIDCLHEIGIELKNDKYNFWEMKNGYALANREGLKNISNQIKTLSENDYEYLKGKLRIGVQWDSEVTISKQRNLITHVYCAALPVAYSNIEKELWSDFAKMILEATYEATFYVALRNYERTKNNKVFLTLIGGGAFGNEKEWIFNAIENSIKKFSNTPLDTKIVSYGASNKELQQFIDSIKNEIH